MLFLGECISFFVGREQEDKMGKDTVLKLVLACIHVTRVIDHESAVEGDAPRFRGASAEPGGTGC